MSLFKKKTVVSKSNSYPAKVKYTVSKIDDGASFHNRKFNIAGEAIITDVHTENEWGVPIDDWVTFPEYANIGEWYCKKSNNPFKMSERVDYERKYEIVGVYSGRLNLNNRLLKKGFIIPDTVKHVGGGFGGVNLILPDGLREIRGYDGVCNRVSRYELKYNGANYYEGGYYYGSRTNPYLVLVYADSSITENFAIHPDTKLINRYAFDDEDGWNFGKRPEFKIKSIFVPKGVHYIAPQSLKLSGREVNVEYEDPDGFAVFGDSLAKVESCNGYSNYFNKGMRKI